MEKYKIQLENSTPKYLQIYNHLKKLILANELEEKEKLPPIRKISEVLDVNNSTIVKVYELLEKDGYVYKIIGSGTYVSVKKSIKEESLGSRDDIIHFDNGTPSADIFPISEFHKAINIALEEEGKSIFEYEEEMGYAGLREKMSDYLKSMDIITSKDNIQIISGAQQGIDVVCKGLINYSDVVFIEEPTYSGAIQVFKSRGAKIVPIPMLDDGIDIGILKVKLEKIKPKLIYTMPNFQNPTGISYSTYKKKKLIELAEEYDFYILEDDFISEFKFDSTDNRTIRSYDDKGRVIYIKSFSKIFMPGLRIGIIEMPFELLNKVIMAKYSSDISTSPLIQKSMYHYMDKFDLNKYLHKVEDIYTEKYKIAKKLIEDKFNGKLKFRSLNGGINFFLELPRGYSSYDFTQFMLTKGVSILPGTYFFDNIIDDRFFRINIARVSIQELEKGIAIINENLDEFIYSYKNKLENNKRLFY